MNDLKTPPRFKVGDEIRLIGGAPLVGRVMELRGYLSADGSMLYRLYVPMEPEPLMLEVREDEIEPNGSAVAST